MEVPTIPRQKLKRRQYWKVLKEKGDGTQPRVKELKFNKDLEGVGTSLKE